MYKCEWDDCHNKFWSIIDLERHVRKHVNEINPESQNDELDNSSSTLNFDKTQSLRIDQQQPQPHEETKSANVQEIWKDEEEEEDNNDILCIICQSGREISGNCIVLCDRCDRAYHQNCHRPIISEATVSDRDAKWYCKKCTSKR